MCLGLIVQGDDKLKQPTDLVTFMSCDVRFATRCQISGKFNLVMKKELSQEAVQPKNTPANESHQMAFI